MNAGLTPGAGFGHTRRMTTRHPTALGHWIDRYDAMFAARRAPWLHAIATLLLAGGVLAALWAVPVPDALRRISVLLNWATLTLIALVVYYFILSLPLALALLPVVVALGVGVGVLAAFTAHLPLIATAAVLMALCLDLAGMREKSLRNLAEFIQLAMLAPLWLFHHAVQRRD